MSADTQAPKNPSLIYIPELDGLRAIAALAVVAFHCQIPGALGGFLGVDVFFVLSGYLTTSLAFASVSRSSPASFVRFTLRRLRRLWPLLITVCFAFIPMILWRGLPILPEILPGSLFYANITTASHGHPVLLVHAWTLGTEMQFYLLIAALAFFVPNRKTAAMVAAVFFLTVTGYRIYVGSQVDWAFGFYSPFTHSSGLFLGAIIAINPLKKIAKPDQLFLIAISILLIAFSGAEFVTELTLMLWISLVEIATAAVIISILVGVGAVAKPLRLPVVRRLGVLSYGIYLWHYPITVALRENYSAGTAFLMTVAASVLLSALSHKFIETRFQVKRA
ncbi:MAG: acyltransferase [Paracoccaceae bacterium]|nr:acyltransferase [Paracoccaceae bacterium]